MQNLAQFSPTFFSPVLKQILQDWVLGGAEAARTGVKRRMEKMTPLNSFGPPASDQQIAELRIVICYLFSDMAMDNPPCPSRK